jgi:hypothetical protein
MGERNDQEDEAVAAAVEYWLAERGAPAEVARRFGVDEDRLAKILETVASIEGKTGASAGPEKTTRHLIWWGIAAFVVAAGLSLLSWLVLAYFN